MEIYYFVRNYFYISRIYLIINYFEMFKDASKIDFY